MKKSIIIILIALLIGGCTENQRARSFGGTEKIKLPKGERLIIATWKESHLWYLTEPMPKGYVPKTRIFREKSSWGAMEGVVIFYESK